VGGGAGGRGAGLWVVAWVVVLGHGGVEEGGKGAQGGGLAGTYSVRMDNRWQTEGVCSGVEVGYFVAGMGSSCELLSN
jgi:hypothetical protein